MSFSDISQAKLLYMKVRTALMTSVESDKKSVAVVLGGGAALGLAHIGVLNVIQKHFNIKGIVGTSMGAIIGGMYALGKSPEWILESLKEYNYLKIFNPMHFDFSMKGFFNGKVLLDELDSYTEKAVIENCEIPFYAVAYDIHTKRSVIIHKGSLSKAMRASSSVPYVFRPFKYEQYLFLDGGVEYPVPVNFAKQLFPDTMIIAVNVQEPLPRTAEFFKPVKAKHSNKKELGFVEVLLESVYGNQAYLSINEIINEKPEIVINPFNPDYSFKDFQKVKEFYELGKKTAEREMSNYLHKTEKVDPLAIYKERIEQIRKNFTEMIPILKDLPNPFKKE